MQIENTLWAPYHREKYITIIPVTGIFHTEMDISTGIPSLISDITGIEELSMILQGFMNQLGRLPDNIDEILSSI